MFEQTLAVAQQKLSALQEESAGKLAKMGVRLSQKEAEVAEKTKLFNDLFSKFTQ
jgi:hypothetical protein